MAEGKNSFILYCDQIKTFSALTEQEAGFVIQWIFKYVNDQNPPMPEDRMMQFIINPIKDQLKRDLKKWDSLREKRVEAGKIGGLKSAEARASNLKQLEANEANASELKQDQANQAVTVNVTATVNDNVNVTETVNDILLKKETKEKFNFKKSLLEICSNENLVDDWMKVRKEKKAVNTKTSFDRIILEIERSGKSPEYCIQMAVFKSWKGFEAKWLENLNNSQNGTGTKQTRIENFEQGFREQFAGKDLSANDGF